MIEIQDARVEDVHAVKWLLSETWLHTYGELFSPKTLETVVETWHRPELLAAQIEDPKTYFAVAKQGSAVIGLVTARRTGFGLWIDRLYVHPEQQRLGLGARLLAAAGEAFPGSETMGLEVEEDNEKGRSFYLKQGFVEEAREQQRLGDESFAVLVMKKSLRSGLGPDEPRPRA